MNSNNPNYSDKKIYEDKTSENITYYNFPMPYNVYWENYTCSPTDEKFIIFDEKPMMYDKKRKTQILLEKNFKPSKNTLMINNRLTNPCLEVATLENVDDIYTFEHIKKEIDEKKKNFMLCEKFWTVIKKHRDLNPKFYDKHVLKNPSSLSSTNKVSFSLDYIRTGTKNLSAKKYINMADETFRRCNAMFQAIDSHMNEETWESYTELIDLDFPIPSFFIERGPPALKINIPISYIESNACVKKNNAIMSCDIIVISYCKDEKYYNIFFDISKHLERYKLNTPSKLLIENIKIRKNHEALHGSPKNE